MKFGDKLIALRKKSGLSQEELAAKLNVSRQSVSKWEGNNSYPETDKIVQICNIFDCSMDDLINESISDLSTIERKSKNNLNIVFDSLLEFVTKTIDMFSSMNFTSGFRCVIEFLIIGGILLLGGAIVTNILTNIIRELMSFLPANAHNIVSGIVNSIFDLLWIILSVIVIVHIFKIRYLDYYEQAADKKKKEDSGSTKKKDSGSTKKEETSKKEGAKDTTNIKKEKDRKIIIRDPNHEPFAFLSVLSKIIIWFVKIIIAWIGLGFIGLLIALVVGLILCIPISQYSPIFVGIALSLIGGIVITTLIILLIFYFIINKNVNAKVYIILFISSIILSGIGIGTSLIGIANIDYKEDTNEIIELKDEKISLKYADNMIITNDYNRNYNYIIDNNMLAGDITVTTKNDSRFTKVQYVQSKVYGMKEYSFYLDAKFNFKELYHIIIKDLKNNIFRDYNDLYENTLSITASQETIVKLKENLSKVYLYNEKETATGFQLSSITDKIQDYENECSAYYDAPTDSVICEEENCQCERKEIITSQGNIIEYACKYNFEG